MKRSLFFARVVTVLLAGVLLTSLAGSAYAETNDTEANKNNFRITQYDIRYSLSKNNDGRSVLQTTETIVANFTTQSQNHGIERYLPESYDDHTTHLEINSVTDEDNNGLHYTTSTDNGNKIVRIGDDDTYVYGQKTYVISYTQQDVTRYYDDTDRDEFYWDTNGTDWRVPIDNLSVTLSIDTSLASSFTGDAYCYQGIAGSTQQCSLTKTDNQISAQASNLAEGQNITLAVGFDKGTFAAYEMTTLDRISLVYTYVKDFLNVAGGIGGAIVIIVLGVVWNRSTKRSSEKVPIVVEYIPPKDTSVTISSVAMPYPYTRNAFTAQLIDFAVRHYIKIYETKPKSPLRSAKYDIEIVQDISTLKDEEKEVLQDIFVNGTQVGARVSLSDTKKSGVAANLSDNYQKASTLAREKYGLYYKDDNKRKPFKVWAIVFAVIGVIASFNLLLLGYALFLAALGYTMWIYTDTGLSLYRYLRGLKKYISAAETERLKMLQSPAGAEKVGAINPNDSSQMVKLYERNLPYAILFGKEKEWGKALEHYYTASNTQPDWLWGANAGIALSSFSSSLRSFSTSTSAASSSSTGGSGGGGFSGGGGGGGGGGGW